MLRIYLFNKRRFHKRRRSFTFLHCENKPLPLPFNSDSSVQQRTTGILPASPVTSARRPVPHLPMISAVKTLSSVLGRIRRSLYLHTRTRLLPLSLGSQSDTRTTSCWAPSSVSRHAIGCGDSGSRKDEIWLVKWSLHSNRIDLFWCRYWTIRTRRHEGNDDIVWVHVQSGARSKAVPASGD